MLNPMIIKNKVLNKFNFSISEIIDTIAEIIVISLRTMNIALLKIFFNSNRLTEIPISNDNKFTARKVKN